MEANSVLIKENNVLREAARKQLKGKWGLAILVCLISSIILSLAGAPRYIGILINLVLTGPVTLGVVSCFVRVARNESFQFENLLDGFKNFNSAFILNLLISIFTLLWSLLFVIPGIIAYYRYSMAFYILNDYPDMKAKAALDASKKMMDGFKGKLFCLHLSFIGWGILSIFTLGIGFLWLIPYVKASEANFYQNLKEASGTQTVALGIE